MAAHFRGEASGNDIPHTSQMLDDDELPEVHSDVYESPTSKRLREEQEGRSHRPTRSASPVIGSQHAKTFARPASNGSEIATKGFVMPQPMTRPVAPKSRHVHFQAPFSMFAPLATPRTAKEEPLRQQAGLTEADNAASPPRSQVVSLEQHVQHREVEHVDIVTR
jgi:hypothetical protein